MPLITATLQPLLWAARQIGLVIETGVTQVGEATGSGVELISNSDENAFLGAVVGSAASYKSLPSSGWLEAGTIYGYAGGLVIVRQSHNRTADVPATVPALFTTYRANATGALDWIVNEKVLVGTLRIYSSVTYRCLQAHQTQTDWTPDKTPALWAVYVIVPPTGAWAIGVAYKVGDKASYNGRLYQCLQAHTSIATWTPLAVPALWKDIGAA